MFSKYFKRKKKDTLGAKLTDIAYILAGLATFTALTLWTFTKSSIWFDEAYSAYMIRFDFMDIARYTAADVHPPLFYWILKIWAMAFGSTEFSLRALSLVFGLVVVILGYLLVKRLFDKRAAQISLLFMVLSPMLIRYSQEARMYTIVAAIALAATYVLTFAVKTTKKLPWVIYGVLVGIGMLTHYFSAIIWIAHWVWRAGVVKQTVKKGKAIKEYFSEGWILAHLVALAIFMPWLPYFINQISDIQTNGFWIAPVNPGTIINYLTNVVYYLNINQVNGWLTICFYGLMTVFALLAYKVYKTLDHSQRVSYQLIMSLAFLPIIILFIGSLPPLRSAFIDRYLMATSVAIALFIGITIYYYGKINRTKNRQGLMIILTVGFMLIGIGNVWDLGNYNKNSNTATYTRQIIELVHKEADPGQPIIAATPWMFYESIFYSTNDHPVYFIEPDEYPYGSLDMLEHNDQFKIKDINSFAKSNPIVWYIGYAGVDQYLELPEHDWKVVRKIFYTDPISGKKTFEAYECQFNN